MNKMYLPIGTICTLKGENKKIVIIGYFSLEYNGLATIRDYCGYVYPEGSLSNKKYTFNHSQIETIIHLGYISEEYEKLNKKLLDQQNKKNVKRIKTNTFFKNIKFDENGVVIFDEPINNTFSTENTNVLNEIVEEKTQDNAFFKKNSTPSNIIENAEDSKNWSIFKNIKFDENGVVIEAIEYDQKETK